MGKILRVLFLLAGGFFAAPGLLGFLLRFQVRSDLHEFVVQGGLEVAGDSVEQGIERLRFQVRQSALLGVERSLGLHCAVPALHGVSETLDLGVRLRAVVRHLVPG